MTSDFWEDFPSDEWDHFYLDDLDWEWDWDWDLDLDNSTDEYFSFEIKRSDPNDVRTWM